MKIKNEKTKEKEKELVYKKISQEIELAMKGIRQEISKKITEALSNMEEALSNGENVEWLSLQEDDYPNKI